MTREQMIDAAVKKTAEVVSAVRFLGGLTPEQLLVALPHGEPNHELQQFARWVGCVWRGKNGSYCFPDL